MRLKTIFAFVSIGTAVAWLYFKHQAEVAALTPTQRAAEVGASVVVSADSLRARGVAIPETPGGTGLVRAKVMSGDALHVDLMVEDAKYPTIASIVRAFPRTAVEGLIG